MSNESLYKLIFSIYPKAFDLLLSSLGCLLTHVKLDVTILEFIPDPNLPVEL